MTEEKRNLLTRTHKDFFDVMLNSFAPEKLKDFVVGDVMGYGTTIDEKVFDLTGLQKLVAIQKEQAEGVDINFETTPVHRNITTDENVAIYVDEIEISMQWSEGKNEFGVRISTILEYQNGKWKIIHWHGSKPVDIEEDTWHKDELKKKNEELQHLVNEKTANLLQKNLELEIEGALERVRTVAMGMQKPDDVLDVCQIISDQLELLNVTDIRNIQVAIIDESKKSYLNYQYFTPYSKKVFEETEYENNPAAHAMVSEMQKSANSFYKGSIKDKALQEFKDWRKKYDQYPDPVLDKSSAVHYYFYSIGNGGLGLTTYKAIRKKDQAVFKRFHKVFELAYHRFHDIENAVAQTRKARIETALERVRAEAMAMHKPGDLSRIGKTIFSELKSLGFDSIRNTEIVINNDERESVTSYHFSDYGQEEIIEIAYKENPIVKNWAEDLKKAEDAFVPVSIPKTELKAWDKYRLELGYKSDPKMASAKGVHSYSYSTGLGALSISTWQALTDDQIKILERFRNVYKLSYQRYKDIEQAEAQAREAQIELALERVRARTMAMQQSDELKNVIQIIFDQLARLSINAEHAGIVVDYKAKADWNFWVAETQDIPSQITVPYLDSLWDRQFTEAKEKGKDFFATQLNFEEKKSFYEKLLKHIPELTKKARDFYYNCPGLSGSTVIQDDIGLYIENFSAIPYSDEENKILMRFGKVFQQTYTRFNDLKQAEAQAREAQIELALERVRARTMAMQQSKELAEVSSLLFHQMQSLGIDTYTSGFNIWDIDNHNLISWMCNADGSLNPPFRMPIKGDDWHAFQYQSWKKGEKFIVKDFSGEEMQSHFKYLRTFPLLDKAFKKSVAAGHPMPERQVHHVANFSNGYLLFITLQPCPESHEIFKRFAKVFEQTYTRFLDLQKAEEQAREAEIELALERIRARSMAMHKSEELANLSLELVKQVQALGVATWFCAFNIYDDDPQGSLEWGSNGEGTFPKYRTPREGVFLRYYEAGQSGETLLINKIDENECPAHYDYLCSLPGVGEQLLKMKGAGIPFPVSQIDHAAFFKYGYILFISYEPVPESHDIFKRFAKVFEQTYTRFLDLQKAEAQAREAQIEATLERIRASTMAMHKSDELREVVRVIYDQLDTLNFEAKACNIIIMDKQTGDMQYWVSGFTQDIFPESYRVPILNHPYLRTQLDAWKRKDNYALFEYSGKEKISFDKLFFTQTEFRNIPEQAKKKMKSLKLVKLSTAFFNYGALQVLGPEPLTEENAKTLQRMAKVFEQTYTRFLDLQKAEEQAREAHIETALEKVRSMTMAMQKGEDIKEVVVLLYKELIALGVTNFVTCGYVEVNEKINKQFTWVTSPGGDSLGLFYLPLTGDATFDERYAAWKQQQITFHQKVAGEVRSKHLEYAITTFNSKEAEEMVLSQFPDPCIFYCFNFSHGYLHLVTGSKLKNEEELLLARFTRVFEQTYARFLDLQKAEAQAREAQIEAALEKVRSRSLAMHKPEELKEVVGLVAEKLQELDVIIDAGGVIICTYFPDNKDVIHWIAETDFSNSGKYLIPYFDDLTFNDAWDSKESGEAFFTKTYNKEEKNNFFNYAFEHTGYKNFPDDFKQFVLKSEKIALSFAWAKNSAIMLPSHTGIVPSENHIEILKRFAKVFEQAYIRFLDLQKAEAQAREAQIETALEKVRSRTMGMQHSHELQDAAVLMFDQIEALGVQIMGCGFNIWDEDRKAATSWMSGLDRIQPPFKTSSSEDIFLRIYEAALRRESLFVEEQAGEELVAHYKYMASIPVFKKILEQLSEKGLSAPSFQIMHCAYFYQGYLMFITLEPATIAHDIFKRFAKVFEQTYTRFLDLQKVEAQAREAQIEAALEKVRSRSLAMQTTNELGDVVTVIVEKLKDLGVVLDANGVVLCTYFQESKDVLHWIASPDFSFTGSYLLPYFDHPIFNDTWQSKESGEAYFSKAFSVEEKNSFFEYTFEHSDYRNFPDEFKQWVFQNDQHILSFAWQKNSAILIPSHTGVVPSEDDVVILKRFAKVFEQAYVRFMDMQKAEKQAREAQIELSLERIRAQVTAMQESTDLLDIVVTMRTEFVSLGHEAHYFWYMRWHPETYEKAMTSGDGTKIGMIMTLPRHIHGDIKLVADWEKSNKPTIVFAMDAETAVDYIHKMITLGDFKQVDPNAPSLDDIRDIGGLTFIMARTKQGEIGFSLPGAVPNPPKEDLDTLARFAGVFDLAYSRFEDLKHAEQRNRETQIELALERSRNQSMRMQRSDELDKTSRVFHEQLQLLGIDSEFSYLWLPDDAKKEHMFWAT